MEKLIEFKERKEKYDYGNEQMDGRNSYSKTDPDATLIPMLETMFKHLDGKYKNVIADSGYESEENYLYLEKNRQTPYIKPQTYKKWKKKSFKKDISKRKNSIPYLKCGKNKAVKKHY